MHTHACLEKLCEVEYKRGAGRVAWPGQSSPLWCCILNSKGIAALSHCHRTCTHTLHMACSWSARTRRSMWVVGVASADAVAVY